MSGAALWWAVGFDTVAVGVWVGTALVLIAIATGAIVARLAAKRLHALSAPATASRRPSPVVR